METTQEQQTTPAPDVATTQPVKGFDPIRKERDELLAQLETLQKENTRLKDSYSRKEEECSRLDRELTEARLSTPTRELPEVNLQVQGLLKESRITLSQIVDSLRRRGPMPYSVEYLEDLGGRIGAGR